jgi:CheY-like chemotaxis protein
MADYDASTLAEELLQLGLVTDAQLQECWEEVGRGETDPEPLLRFFERKGYLTPYQSHKLRKGDIDGYFLGGYKVLYKIASGSFGRVFRGEDPATGRVVAMKVLRRRWSEDEHAVELFEREGRVGLSLRHPNIVEILAVNQDRATRQYFIVMEFVEGGNLRDILAIRKRLVPAEALRLIEDATAGIAYAYSRGVTHRDLKLTNILLSSQGQAKLVDFGLAGLLRSLGRAEDDGLVDRTVDYAGLEKATGVPAGDVRSDIYFLGCVLYEMLTGRPPLVMTKDPRARMRKQRFDEVPAIKRTEVSAPPSVFHLVETMMALNPQHRYQTPSQLMDAVRAARRDIEAGKDAARPAAAASTARTVFVVERDERLQDALRDKLKELGYRVFLAADPARAMDRYRHQPYDGLIVDAGTTGEDGLFLFERIMAEAQRLGMDCGGILVLSEDQKDWVQRIPARAGVSVLVRPVTLKQLHRKLQELVPVDQAG